MLGIRLSREHFRVDKRFCTQEDILLIKIRLCYDRSCERKMYKTKGFCHSPINIVHQQVRECVEVSGSVLQCVAVSGSVWQWVEVCGSEWKCVAVSRSAREWAGENTDSYGSERINWLEKIGRAHVWTLVTSAHLVCRLLLDKKTTI